MNNTCFQNRVIAWWFRLMLTIIIPLSIANAQATWSRIYGGDSDALGFSVIQADDGSFLATGQINRNEDYNYDLWLIKTDLNGDTLWTRQYGESLDEAGYSMIQTAENGYLIVGSRSSHETGDSDVYLVKTDSVGDTLWTRQYGGENRWEGSMSIIQTDDGYLFTGYKSTDGLNGKDVWLVKINSQGDTLWTQTYGGSGWEEGSSLINTVDGGFLIAGTTTSFGAGYPDYWLIKTDSEGDTLWTHAYGGTAFDDGKSVIQTIDGGYLVAGHTYSFGAGLWDIWLIKTDSQGDTLWTRTYGGSETDLAYHVIQSIDGGYLVVGSTQSFGAGSRDAWLVKTDSLGNTLWTRTYGGAEWDEGWSLIETDDDGYLVAGTSGSWTQLFNLWLIKIDTEGNTTGVSVKETTGSRPSSIGSLTLYPNPFNPSTTIEYELPEQSNVSLVVYDITGREVTTLVNQTKQPGNYKSHWNGMDNTGNQLPAGMYFARLQIGDYSSVVKMVYLQ